MTELLVIAAASAGVPSVAWMVVGIVRLIVLLRLTRHALDECTESQIPNVLRASAYLASTLTSDQGLRHRAHPPRTTRRSMG